MPDSKSKNTEPHTYLTLLLVHGKSDCAKALECYVIGNCCLVRKMDTLQSSILMAMEMRTSFMNMTPVSSI